MSFAMTQDKLDALDEIMGIVDHQVMRLKEAGKTRLLEIDESRMLKGYGELRLQYEAWRKKTDEAELDDMDYDELIEKFLSLTGAK